MYQKKQNFFLAPAPANADIRLANTDISLAEPDIG